MSEDSRKKFFSGAIVDAGMQNDLQLFNSLLARGKSNNVRDRNKSLLLTGVLGIFQGKQRKLQQKLLKNLTGLDEAFKEESASRQTIYDKENENRNFYDKYVKNPEQGVVDYAEMLYNNDESIKQSNVTFKNKSELTDPNAKFLADQLWEESKKQAKIELEAMKDNPLITSRTFQEYNKAYDDAYKSEYARLENDPTQSSLLASAANSIFPSWFDDRKAKLQSVVDKANVVVEMQEEEELFNPAVASYLAAQPKLDKTKALEFINTTYDDKVSPEILNQMEESITKMKSDETITSDEILGIALSKVNLNRNNRTELQKAIALKTEIFNDQWKRSANTGGVVPNPGDELFETYKKELNENLSFTVFEADADVRKIGLLRAKINSTTTSDESKKIYIKQLRKYEKNDIIKSIQITAGNYLSNPVNNAEIDSEIAREKGNAGDAARYTDRPSFEEYYYKQIMAQQAYILDLVESSEQEENTLN